MVCVRCGNTNIKKGFWELVDCYKCKKCGMVYKPQQDKWFVGYITSSFGEKKPFGLEEEWIRKGE